MTPSRWWRPRRPAPRPSAPAPVATPRPVSAPVPSVPAVPATPAPAPVPTMPLGDLPNWQFARAQNFITPASKGQVAKVYSDFAIYDGFGDTSKNGLYSASTLSVADSSLIYDMSIVNGQALVSCVLPFGWGGQVYGRYSMRVRGWAEGTISDFKTAFMLWPVSDIWAEGEIDFPETDLPKTVLAAGERPATVTGFSHKVGQPQDNALVAPTSVTLRDWHIYTIEWSPKGVTFILDDKVIGSTTDSPSKPLRLTLQAETSLTGPKPAPSAVGRVEIDWVVVHKWVGK